MFKLFKFARPVRTDDSIKMYDDTVRVEKQPRRGGKWNVYKLRGKRFIQVGQANSLGAAIKTAKRV